MKLNCPLTKEFFCYKNYISGKKTLDFTTEKPFFISNAFGFFGNFAVGFCFKPEGNSAWK